MKAILISDHPKWCALMMNGDKTVEVRKGTALYKATKKLIDEYGYAEFYVCCTKNKSGDNDGNVIGRCYPPQISLKVIGGRGKVIFKFRCYKVEEINTIQYWDMNTPFYWTKTLNTNLRLQKASCLFDTEIYMYLGSKQGYAIHISDLEIFDKPKELSEFYKVGHYEDLDDYFTDEKQINGKWCIPLKKSPQSFCYIEVEDVL